MKRLFWIIAGGCLLLAAAVVVIPLMIDLEWVKTRWLPVIEHALGREVSVGRVRLSLLPLGVTVRDVTVMDDPSFARSPFLTSDAIDVRVAWWPLLHRDVEVTDLVIKKPQLTLIRNPQGRWNYESVGAAPVSAAHPAAPLSDRAAGRSAPLLLPEAFSIFGGKITIVDQTPDAPRAQTVGESINLSVRDVAPGRKATVKLSARVNPWPESVSMAGDIDLLPTGLGIVAADVRITIGGNDLRLTARLNSEDGGRGDQSPTWVVRVESRRLVINHLVAKAVHAEGQLDAEQLKIESARAELFGGSVEAKGVLAWHGADRAFNADLAADHIIVGDLVRYLTGAEPVLTGTGRLTASINGETGSSPTWSEIAGRLRGTGKIVIRNGALRGVDLPGTVVNFLKKTQRAALSAPIRQETPFSSLDGTVALQNGRATITALHVTAEDFSLETSGLVDLAPSIGLDLRAEMQLSTVVSRQFSSTSTVGLLLTDQGRLAIPVLIKGTMAKPIILPDATLLAKRTRHRLTEEVMNEVMSDKVEQLQQTGKALLKGLLGR